MPDGLEDYLDPPKPQPFRTKKGALKFQPDSDWSLNRLPEVESEYQKATGQKLPVSVRGQGRIHDQWNYDHRDSADVGLNPNSKEGQALIAQLQSQNVPFLAFDKAIPGVATGPHVHIGRPSKHKQTEQKPSRLDDYLDPMPLDNYLDAPPESPRTTRFGVRRAQIRPNRGAGQQPAGGMSIGELRQQDEPAVAQSEFVKAQQAQQSGARAMRERPMSAEARLYDPRANVSEVAARKQAAISTEDEWRTRNESAVQRQTQQYRNQIKNSGSDPLKWLTEVQARGGAGLTEFAAGVTSPFSDKATDALRIRAEAAARAAQEEGADRGAVSKIVQEVTGGFLGSIPELAAMSVGIPAIPTFAVGGGLRAAGSGRDVPEAVLHGAATGAAFEIPVGGEGMRRVLKRAGTVGAATTGVELAAGAPLSEALKTGATNAAIVGVPEALGHYSKYQPRRQRGEGKGQFKKGQPEYPETVPAPPETPPAKLGELEPYLDAPEVVREAEQRQVKREFDQIRDREGVRGEFNRISADQPAEISVTPAEVLPEEAAQPQKASTAPTSTPEAPGKEVTNESTEVASEPVDPNIKRSEAGVAPNKPITAPAEPSTTSARKAQFAIDRKALDLPQLPPSERKAWQNTLDQAKERGTQNASVLADEVLKKPRALNDVETGQLVLRAQEIKNQHFEVMREIGDATDSQTIGAKRAQVEALEREFDKITEAAKASGTEKGRTLAAQKLTINQDYDLVSLIQRAKAKKGRDLTTEERARYEKMSTEIDDLTRRLSKAEERLSAKQLQREIDRITRRGKRVETKTELDDEFAQLSAQFAQARIQARTGIQPMGLAALDPEGTLTPLIAKMARNRVRAGVLKAEDVVDQVYNAVREHVEGITKRDVRDAISGYGIERNREPRAEDVKQLAAVKSELKRLSAQEDIASGKRLSPQDKTRQTILLKQEAELTRKLEQRDFSDKPKRQPIVYDRSTQVIADRVARIKAEYERELDRERPGRWWRNLSAMRKAWMLSGPVTHVRNIVGTAAYQPFDEFARLPAFMADAALSKVTNQRSISAPSPAAMLDSVIHAIRQGGSEARSILKHGATAEDMMRHQYREIDTGVKAIDIAHNAIFRFMSASDRVFYQGAYKRNLSDRALIQAKNEARTDKTVNVKERAKELTENPTEELDASAKHDALVNTFNNDNKLSDAIRRDRSALSPPANFAVDLVMPFDRTPTNVIARVLEASPYGYARNAKQLAKAFTDQSMTVEEQRSFSQTFGRATAGTAIMALGWHLASKGILTWDEKRRAIYLEIAGKRINLSALSPVGTFLAVGAGQYREHKTESGLSKRVGSALQPLADQPLLRGTSELGDLVRDPSRSAGKSVARLAGSFVPFSGALRFAGEMTDSKDRKATGLKENFQRNIPGWRNQLPEETKTSRDNIREILKERIRRGLDTDVESAVREGKITRSDQKSIEKYSKLSPTQERFDRLRPGTALDRFSRMDAAQRAEVESIMARKAHILTTSDSLTDDEKEAFQKRIEALGVTPRAPSRSGGFRTDFTRRERSSFR